MKIAIQGHPTRGKEVIQILESLGGKNTHKLHGKGKDCVYYYHIDSCGVIAFSSKYDLCNHKFYTLEEFEKEFPFKIGDKIITTDGTIGIIDKFKPGEYPYCIKADVGGFYWCATSILKPYKEMKKERNVTLTLEKAKEWYKKGGELKEVALQAYSKEELNPLPRSWKEFCDNYPVRKGETWLGVQDNINDCIDDLQPRYYKNWIPSKKSAEAHLAMIQLEQLRNCWRNGWKLDYDSGVNKYGIICMNGVVQESNPTTNWERHLNKVLDFPTPEMRNAFKENFDPDVEFYKELL